MTQNASVTVKVKCLDHFQGELPRYETSHASGLDVRACLSEPVALKPGERALIPTGLAFEIPQGFEIQVRPRSGWAAKFGMALVNSPGTIDADYRGEVKVIVINLGQETVVVQPQDRVAQLVLCPVFHLEWSKQNQLAESVRGEHGFGSTGRG